MAKIKITQTIVTVEIRVNHPATMNLNSNELENSIKITGKDGLKIMGAEFTLLQH